MQIELSNSTHQGDKKSYCLAKAWPSFTFWVRHCSHVIGKKSGRLGAQGPFDLPNRGFVFLIMVAKIIIHIQQRSIKDVEVDHKV